MTEIDTPSSRASFHSLKVFDHVTRTTITSDNTMQADSTVVTGEDRGDIQIEIL